VFYFIHDLAPYGAQRVVLYAVKKLDKKIFRATVCSFWGEETLATEFKRCGAEVVFLRARRFLDPVAWIRFVYLLFRARPDIIQTNLAELSFPVRLLSLFLPGLHVVHNVQNPLSSEPWYWRFLNRMTLRMCDAIAFSGKGIVEKGIQQAPSLKSRFFVVQNSVELDVPPAGAGAGLREELGITADGKVIGCVGRLVRQKGQDILINAAAVLAREKRRIRLLLVGDGELLPELQEEVKRLELEREVIFLGRRADIARILSACDIYAAPSRWESFNIALGEAMLSGRPCVATDIPGHADLLLDGVTGVAIPTENVDALAKAIAQLMDNPVGAQKLAAAATELVRTEFTVEKMAAKYEKLYLDVRWR
jgi:glycosyltransferase involved in cell wall biosynthesis